MTISFQCLPGYTLLGEASLTCLHGISRNWNHPVPRCEGTEPTEKQLLLYFMRRSGGNMDHIWMQYFNCELKAYHLFMSLHYCLLQLYVRQCSSPKVLIMSWFCFVLRQHFAVVISRLSMGPSTLRATRLTTPILKTAYGASEYLQATASTSTSPCSTPSPSTTTSPSGRTSASGLWELLP